MQYGIPGSPEGHIAGVDLKMKNQNQKFKYHSDIDFGLFKTFDLEQGYINFWSQLFFGVAGSQTDAQGESGDTDSSRSMS